MHKTKKISRHSAPSVTERSRSTGGWGLGFFLLLFLFFISCGREIEIPIIPDPEPPTPPTEIPFGVSYSTATPDADSPLTIRFRARTTETAGLYGYTGDVYVHIGVVSEGVWQHVPAEWNENTDKCKMSKIADTDYAWEIELKPTVREWFGSGETPVNRIGIVFRNADGQRKGIEGDTFISVTDEQFKLFQPGEMVRQPMPGGLLHGINIVNSSTVTLVLFDRDNQGQSFDFAHVVGDFNDWTLSNDPTSQMYRDDAEGVWWITIDGLNARNEYAFQYYIGKRNGEPLRIADPYARKILDPWNDPFIPASVYPGLTFPAGARGLTSVFQIEPEAYQWQTQNFQIPSRDNLVIYELLLRDFTGTHQTIGTLADAIARLDYLQALGVNAISLMPVQEFDDNDSWGYNPAFFFALDKAYGTSNMYKRFVDEANRRGIAVILDVVYNHATGANPWVRMWWNPVLNRPATNNPFFNPVAPHRAFGWFYDFNHESPLVRDFVIRNLQFLLQEYRFSGFRFDFTKGFTQRVTTTNEQMSERDDSRIAILKTYNDAIRAVKPEALVILEHFTADDEEIILSEAGMMMWRNLNWAYSQSGLGTPDGSDFRRGYYATSTPRRPANSLVTYMESHDEERVAFRQQNFGIGHLRTDLTTQTRQLATNAAFFFTIPGSIMIWQFGEMAYDFSINYNPSTGSYDGRTSRKPVRWDYLNVPERRQLHDTYARLASLRHDHPELFTPDAQLEWQVATTYWTNGRFLTLSSADHSKRVVVVGNFTNNAGNFNTTFPQTGTWYNFMYPQETLNVTSSTMSVSVPANEFRMFTTFVP